MAILMVLEGGDKQSASSGDCTLERRVKRSTEYCSNNINNVATLQYCCNVLCCMENTRTHTTQNIGTILLMLLQHCRNIVAMFCVVWETYIQGEPF